MASVHRQTGNPNWCCAFYGADGKRKFISTKEKNRKQAEIICNTWAKAARKARMGKLSVEKAREIIEEGVAEIMESSGHVLPHSSIREYFKSWMTEKETVSSEGTADRYRGIVERFLKFLGPRASQSLSTLTLAEIQSFRDELMQDVSAGTVNTYLKVLRVALGRAVRQRYISTNPAVLIEKVKRERDSIERRAFTLDELRELLKAADDEWRLMTLTGLYTGLRLQDIANLTWNDLDLEQRDILLTTQKTGRRQVIPIHSALFREVQKVLEKRPASDDPRATIFPSLAGKGSGWLSSQFYDLMASVKLVPKRGHQKHGRSKGRGSRRTLSPISFHALRHTATSLLKNAGVSDVVARDLIGHESKAVSAHYTHIETSTKRAAIDKMPDVLAWSKNLL